MTEDGRAGRTGRPARSRVPSLPRGAAPSPAPERVRAPRTAPGAHQLAGPVRGGVASPSGPGGGFAGATMGASGVSGASGASGASGGLAVSGRAAPLLLPAVLDRAAADRQLVVGAVTVIFLARAVDGPVAWFVAVVLGLAVLVGAGWSRVTAEAPSDAGEPVPTFRARWESVVTGAAGIESGILPGVLAASLALSVRLVPLDWRLAAAMLAAFVLLDRTIRLERALARSTSHELDRWKVVLATLAAAFLGFAGVASMVSGGMAGVGAATLGEADLLLLAAGDAVIALLLGFRLARLGPASRREAVVSGVGFAAVVAIGAGLLRAMAIPQLLGPALLTLLLYLWDALNATTPSIRRDPRWRWQVGLLLVLSAVVIAWNLRLRA